ncbi:universal stress protein [Jiella sp. MQZ9-1]|uniref:Universal stress protein n=1 Tax=Jiella flava TaxID=2816857 RepID=A0A939FZN0_9HYPH|nr:universal stress protein [Jiella flava]MBO0664530.1 universal stress protein [Jiella flava]MCD2473164.1 universal stress protein [Jiella flava]
MGTTFTRRPANAATTAPAIADLAVFLTGAATDESAIAYGEILAAEFAAHLDCHLLNHIPTPILTAAPGSEVLAAENARLGRETGDRLQAKLRERLARLAVAFDLRRSDGTLGELRYAVMRQCGVVDIALQPQRAIVEAPDMSLFEAVLFDARMPILIVPDTGPALAHLPQTAFVAFRDTPECARAVAAALPLLKRVGSVILANIAEDGASEQRKNEPMSDMARHLARHGIAVEVKELPNWRDPAEGLIEAAGIAGAELVVAGAYGHSRLREYLLGGVTRALIRHCPVPLLMAH